MSWIVGIVSKSMTVYALTIVPLVLQTSELSLRGWKMRKTFSRWHCWRDAARTVPCFFRKSLFGKSCS